MTTTQTQVRSTEEALKLALEAMRGLYGGWRCESAIKACEEALAQPEQRSVSEQQEPVAFLVYDPRVQSQELYFDDDLGDTDCCEITPLYTTPPQRTAAVGEDTQRAWVGLTPDDFRQLEKETTVNGYNGDYCPTWDLIEAVEAKLKAKNERLEKNT